MDKLFNKAITIADIHFGRSGNSATANKDNLDFLQWAIDEAKTFGADTCIMLGDWHDNRHSLHVSTMLASLDGMDLLNNNFKTIWWLVGNHDLLYRDRRDAASIEFSRYLENVKIIREPTTIEDVTFLPWLLEGEHKTIKTKSRYIFSHLELPNFLMNEKSGEFQEKEDSPDRKMFKASDYVFTGHFHMRQFKENICYTGNAMPFNFSDDGDDDKGIMLLEYGKEPSFKKWPGQPLYRSMKLSEMVSEPDKLLRQNMTVRVSIDLPLRYEEAQEIRDELIKVYSLRKIELINGTIEEQDFVDPDIKFRSVDQIIIEGLSDVDSAELNNQRLIDIYLSLPKYTI
jgi:DNA repair exonuclease SbcCD nuclease subunit